MLNNIINNKSNAIFRQPQTFENTQLKLSFANPVIKPVIKPRPIEPVTKPQPIEPIIKPQPIEPVIKPQPIEPVINPQPIVKEAINDTVTLEQKYENKTIYIISNIQGGGSKKYLDDITSHYTNTEFIYIKYRELLLSTVFLPTDILFVQHLLFTDIFPEDINKVKKKYNVKTIISIHDFYWFIPNVPNIDNLLHIIPTLPYYENIYLNPPTSFHPTILTLFENASIVIHPSSFTKKHFDTFFRKDNTIVQYHNDIKIDYTVKQIPKIINKQINIGNFQPFSPYKGSEFVSLLQNKYQVYKGYKINFLVLGKNIPEYTELNWYEEIKEHYFHCLLHLNKYGETYSYSLTKSINSGLPILYNNIGAFKERIPINEHYIQVYDSESDMINLDILYRQFEKMLDYIIYNQGKFNTSNSNTDIEYKDVYNYMFEDKLTPSMNSILHKKIKPFALYFPQFHAIPENNKNYYHGMTDMLNLKHYIQHQKKPDEIIDTPSLSELSIPTLLHYTLTNKKIIKKQIDIAKKFSIYGFACYYYWFSENSITNKHTIFENCYDLFFQEEISDFKIYFIWANENWSNNVSFNVAQEKIINVYTFDNYMKNIKNLIKYFKHPNYYKIENKPVFFIHHPWNMSSEQLCVFNYVLDSECIKNGFNGVIVQMNNMKNTNSTDNVYNCSPTNKGGESSDYYVYTDTIIEPQLNKIKIQTIFFDFNNSARFSNPYKQIYIYKFENTTIYNQDRLVDMILTRYKQESTEIDKIVLINSWNEWGENMAIEPGEINKTKYLSLIKSNLLSFLS
jgi:hypothetical protein